jgi:hypothetical protein
MIAACSWWDHHPHNSTLLLTNNQSDSLGAYERMNSCSSAMATISLIVATAMPLEPLRLHGKRRFEPWLIKPARINPPFWGDWELELWNHGNSRYSRNTPNSRLLLEPCGGMGIKESREFQY